MRIHFFILTLLLAGAVFGAPLKLKVGSMLAAATTTATGTTYGPATSGEKTFHASVAGTGSVSATVLIEVSNDPTNLGWVTLGTITLSGTTSATDGFASQAGWAYYRARVSAISGTGATVNVTVAQE